MLDVRSQHIMRYTLMVVLTGQQSTRFFTLMATLQGPVERWSLAHINYSESAHNGAFPDGPLSESTVYLRPTWQHNFEVGSFPTQVNMRRYHGETDLVWESHSKLFQTLQSSSPSRHHNKSNNNLKPVKLQKTPIFLILCFIIEFFRLHSFTYKRGYN